jgi:putative ABC transport system substrate-binding protein
MISTHRKSLSEGGWLAVILFLTVVAINRYGPTLSVEAGALMSYGSDIRVEARRVAAQIIEILNGGKPAEMLFFEETHWDLVINLKAAKELGLAIPDGLVAGADRVIE